MQRPTKDRADERADGRGGGAEASAIEPIDVLRYARGFRDKWWLFAILFTLAGGNVFLHEMRRRPEYRAGAEVKILRQPESFTRFSPLIDETLRTAEDLNTLLGVFRSRLFVDRVGMRVRRENLDRFLEPYREPGASADPPPVEALLAANREVVPERNSLIVSVSYTHPRPDVAAEVTNFFLEEFTAYENELQADAEQRAVRELRAKAETQRRKIENLEKELISFKERHDTVSFDRRSDIDGQELLFLTNALSEDKREFDTIGSRVEILDRVLAEGRPAWEAPAIAESPRVSQLMATVGGQRVELSRLGARYRPEHPKMIAAAGALAEAERELDRLLAAEVAALRNRLDQARADHAASAAKLAAKKLSILELQRLQADYDSMVRDVESNRQVHQYLYQRVQESESQSRSAGMNVRVVYRAAAPLAPVRPSVAYGAGLGMAIGGFFAFVVVLAVLVFDQKLKSQRDVERELGLPVLAAVERLPGGAVRDARAAGRMLRTASTRETLGTLAAGLRFGPGGGAAKTLLVVSPLGGDGKSSLAAALAGSFRRMGERVLVVSADLRGPAAALPAGIEPLRALGPRAPGGIDRFIGRDEETGADVVHGGGWVDNPWALFNSVEFALFFEAVKARYDRIVVDTPPLAVFGDALALTPFADLALFVFGFNKVPVRTARRTLRSIAETGLPVAGVVVNGVRPFDLRVHFPGHHKRRGSYRAYGGRSAGAPRPEVAEAGP